MNSILDIAEPGIYDCHFSDVWPYTLPNEMGPKRISIFGRSLLFENYTYDRNTHTGTVRITSTIDTTSTFSQSSWLSTTIIVGAMLLGLGILGWLIFDKVEKVVDKPEISLSIFAFSLVALALVYYFVFKKAG